jgi:hypothetical protein
MKTGWIGYTAISVNNYKHKLRQRTDLIYREEGA